ncbi:peptidylprolyl isomerase [Flavobacterium sp.]|uniref:peptidylprolyl isomerase n=1 Tax=Flavobacterium sp. TaxID=239 RepID=UPI002611BD77|nr:peptidylprolyl isomerase [Flavobacterium sp.]MDD2985059.1 peptidylprolyl isomerase [Flavobacterium sp.]
MAILGKIRQRSFILIVIIALALFSFVLADVINSGGFASTSNNVGSINGKDIAFEEFRLKVANTEKSGQGMSTTQAVNRVWEQEINVALLTEELEKLGIRISEKHLIETLKSDPNFGQNPSFQNELKQFDINKYREYIKASSNPQEVEYFESTEASANINSKYQLYSSLVKGGFFTTQNDAKFKYEMQNNKVSFDYVAVPYSSIKDSDVAVTDQEIVDYMKKNEKKFKSEETREIEYVVMEDKPSDADKTDIQNKLSALLNPRVVYNKETGANDTIVGFANTPNLVEFVNANSDFPYDSTYVGKSDLPAEHAEQIFNLAEGQIYGPYQYGDYYALSRSMGRKAGAKARASHILISFTGSRAQPKEDRTKEQAKVKADELMAQINANPDSFTMLAFTVSEDQGSAQKGGDLDFFSPGQMVPAFNDFVFNNPVGKIGLVETEFGYHIIQVTDKQDAIRLATIAQKIEASEKTSEVAYTNAVKFEVAATEKSFETALKESKLTAVPAVRVKAFDENLGQLGPQRQVVRWAFEKDTDVNTIKRFEIPKVGHVIARLKKINEEGLLNIEDARVRVEPILKNKKKAEKIMAKMKGSSLEAIATANAVQVQNAADITLESPMVASSGYEPKVVGLAFSTAANKISAPIEGNASVFVLKTTTVTKALPTKDYSAQLNALKAQSAQGVNRVFPALKEKAEITDTRFQFNY